MVEGMISVTPDSILHERKPSSILTQDSALQLSCLNSSGNGVDCLCAKPIVHSSSAFFEHKQRFKRSIGTTKEHKLQLSFETCPSEVRLFSVLTAMQMAEINSFICFILAWKVEFKRKGAIGVQLEVYCCGRAQEVVLF